MEPDRRQEARIQMEIMQVERSPQVAAPMEERHLLVEVGLWGQIIKQRASEVQREVRILTEAEAVRSVAPPAVPWGEAAPGEEAKTKAMEPSGIPGMIRGER